MEVESSSWSSESHDKVKIIDQPSNAVSDYSERPRRAMKKKPLSSNVSGTSQKRTGSVEQSAASAGQDENASIE